MTIEPDAMEIENLALLKLGAAPDRCERWQVGTVCAISSAHANDYRAVFVGHRVKVINRLEIPGNFLLGGLDDLFFLSIDELIYLRCFLHDAVQPIDTRDIGAKIQTERRIDAQKSRNRHGLLVADQKRMLLRWTTVRHDFDFGAGHRCFDSRFDLLERFHSTF